MFEAVKHIEVDRKNSLPTKDFTYRYRKTSTPVVFGDLVHRWASYQAWSLPYLDNEFGHKMVGLCSNKSGLNGGCPTKPVQEMAFSDFLELLNHDEDDLHIRNIDFLKLQPALVHDFEYPRLRLKFRTALTTLSIGGKGSKEIMHTRADLGDTLITNFGDRKTVLLIPAKQAKYTYEMPWLFESLPELNYSREDARTHKAIRKLKGYRTTLDHGETLYIPSRYRYAVENHGICMSIEMVAPPTNGWRKLRAIKNLYLIRPLNWSLQKLAGTRWRKRQERKARKLAERKG